MKAVNYLLFIGLSVFMLQSCGEDNEQNQEVIEQEIVDPVAISIEAYIDSVENTDYQVMNSLSYGKEDGSSAMAQVFVDDSSRAVKIAERYTTSKSSSYQSNYFYYKKGEKVATKQYFEEGEGEKAHFVELVTYYTNGKPTLAKRRQAEYEDELEYAEFQKAEPKELKEDNVNDIFNQVGPYSTTFQGFIQSQEDGTLYLIVGEDTPTGYTSALMVQQRVPIINRLLSDQLAYVGKELVVEFETLSDGTGYDFQLLTGIGIKE